MSERFKTPDAKTLGLVLAPQSPEATIIKTNLDGTRALLLESVQLNLPSDFIMTRFDEFVLNHLYLGSSISKVRKALVEQFARRAISVHISKDTVEEYLSVLRGNPPWKDDRLVHSGSFPSVREGYNALHMLETGVFPEYKRSLQEITALILSNYPASDATKSLGICTIAPIVDLMILDLFEIAPGELNQIVEKGAHEYVNTHNTRTSFDKFLQEFRAGFVLKAPPRTQNKDFDKMLNREISILWLEKLKQDPTQFRPEDMEYVLQALEIFVRSFERAHRRGLGKDVEMGFVNKWAREKYKASVKNMGSVIVRIAMGLDYDGESVAEIEERGISCIKSYPIFGILQTTT